MRSAFIILCLSFALSLRAQHRAEFTTSIASNLNQSIIQQWLHHNSAALKTVYGGLPNKPFQIRVQGAHWSWENVPGGRVSRGNINTIHFTVNTRASLQDLKSDWTAYHEFSHLLLPYRGWGDLWFSEGLASYYQNVIQARSGQITAQQAWQKIVAGFARGRRSNPAPHLPLQMSANNSAAIMPTTGCTGAAPGTFSQPTFVCAPKGRTKAWMVLFCTWTTAVLSEV